MASSHVQERIQRLGDLEETAYVDPRFTYGSEMRSHLTIFGASLG
ncbi:hypothetical protein [Streptomyces sp. NPDC052811]